MMEQLGCTAIETATFLSLKGPLKVFGEFATGALEGVLLTRGFDMLTLRKVSTAFAAAMQSVCLTCFGLTKTPLLAACFNIGAECCYGFHHSGFSANLLEVGGDDAAILTAVSNTLGNAPGIIVPPLGVALHKATGSWLPLFLSGSAINLVGGLAFARWASLKSGRELLSERDQSAGA